MSHPVEGGNPFVLCCICSQPFTLKNQYGRDGCACSKECYREFDWRRTLSIMGKLYRIDPERLK